MKILLTGATGYIGSVIAEKLQQAGHHVVGLARSEVSAEALMARGIESVRGDLDSPQSLIAAAAATDGVILAAAFKIEGSDYAKALAVERAAVGALLKSMKGTGKPLIYTSGTTVLGDTGKIVFDERTPIIFHQHAQEFGEKIETEKDVLHAQGVRGIVLRPPSVYGRSDGHATLSFLRAAAQSLGAVPYATGTGDHQWSFVHVEDLADLYVLALEKGKAGELFHAGAMAGLRTKAIAEAVSHGLGLRGKTVELDISALGEAFKLPPMAFYWSTNSQSSSEKARRSLGWKPLHVQMLTELAHEKL
jgi:nucleoside-diphosphate-sugar epimerase